MEIYHSSSYSRILDKLHHFVRRYYQAAIIRGLVISGIGTITLWFFLFLLEYFLFLPGIFRFYFLILGCLLPVICIAGFVIPALFALLNIRQGLSRSQAAELITSHFTEIRDRLVNILQLGQNVETNEDLSLIFAAIDQKAKEIDPYDFKQVITIKPPKWLVRSVIFILLVIVTAVYLRPGILMQSPGRVFNYDKFYERPAPFSFVLLSDSLEVYQGRDFLVKVKIEGEVLPSEVRLVTSKGIFLMTRTNEPDLFEFRLKELLFDATFHFTAAGIVSDEYKLKVRQLPGINFFRVTVSFPGYLNRLPEIVEGTGDLIVPAGSDLDWKIGLKGEAFIDFLIGSTRISPISLHDRQVNFKKFITTSFRYTIILTDSHKQIVDSLSYNCQVIADQAPTIRVIQSGDTATPDLFFFNGQISDDHGISKLVFSYGLAGYQSVFTSIIIPVAEGVLSTDFYYSLQIDSLNLEPGKDYEAWFTVFDNNYSTGPSSARSSVFHLRKFTREELTEISREMNESSLVKLKDLFKSSLTQKNQLDDIEYKLKTQSEDEWHDRNRLKDAIEKQKDSYESLQTLKNKLKQESGIRSSLSDSYLEKFSAKEQNLMELMHQILDEKTLKNLDEMQKLIDSISRDKLKDQVMDIKKSLEQLEENLDRSLELFKELTLQKEIFDAAEKLKELSNRQLQLMNQSKDTKSIPDNRVTDQSIIKSEFENLQSIFDSIDKQSNDLKRDSLSGFFRGNEQKVSKSLKQSEKNLLKGSMQQAKIDQKEAADKMTAMSNELFSSLEEDEQQSLEESILKLRLVLQNVIESSFQQERLLNLTSHINFNDPGFIHLGSEQRMLMSGLGAMHDSLRELSKRESSIPPFLFSLFRQIDETMHSVLHQFEERKLSAMVVGQRNALTDINNLALLLNEAMMNLQQQSNMNMMNSGNCKNSKPRQGKQGKPSLKSLRQAQEQLNQQLQQLQQTGKSNGSNKEQMHPTGEQFSRLAMEQSRIRRELESYMKSIQDESGVTGDGLQKIAGEMEKSEVDLVYKRLSSSTLDKQKKILTRLLESENAEIEREKEERRESRNGILEQESNPFQNFRYNRLKRKGDDVFQRENLKFNSFFQQKVILYEHNTVK